MTTTEKRLSDSDLTVLVERASQGSWDSQLGPASGTMWDEVPHVTKNSYREQVLSIIFHGTKALHELGYRKPRTVTTVEELDALAEGSVVMGSDADGDPLVSTKQYGEWWQAGTDDGWQAPGLIEECGNVTVIHETEAGVGA